MANNTVNISASNPASYLYALSVNAPDKVLFTEANIELTAKALYKKASGLNHFLAQSGVSAGDNIAIFLPRGMDAVIAIYAVLMTGACYIPLDTSGPQARNLFIIKDACCRSIVSNDQAPKWLADSGIVTINTDMLPSVSLQEPPGALYSQPDAPAAILYTSGSTGNPKGVVISQRAISAFVQWASNVFNLNVQDVAASLSPFHFDLSLFDLFAVPAAGANTVFIPDALKLSPSRLTDWLAQNTISLWYTVPSILVFIALKGGLDKKNLPQLKQILFAGEVFPMDSLIRLTGLLPETKFYNLFGPTETNVCLYWPVDRKRLTAGEDIPVGYPACEAELGIDPEQGELLVKG
ncbi:MAG: AMP-binding protein, partial [Gammaproteobacteria bacterium]